MLTEIEDIICEAVTYDNEDEMTKKAHDMVLHLLLSNKIKANDIDIWASIVEAHVLAEEFIPDVTQLLSRMAKTQPKNVLGWFDGKMVLNIYTACWRTANLSMGSIWTISAVSQLGQARKLMQFWWTRMKNWEKPMEDE